IERMLPALSAAKLADMVALASIPEDIRGFGHVKQRTLAGALEKQSRILARLDKGEGSDLHAA
ncbi:MAG: hypothetical protein Q7U14_12645, partial [Lacisediminimonas sp.]|nr:hypothetical protein [Lacisediminimonas sp.]